MPLILTQHLLIFFKKLEDPIMTDRYGHLYGELDLRKGKPTLIQPFFFILRRLMLAVAIVIVN